jgi:hypothetical protein
MINCPEVDMERAEIEEALPVIQINGVHYLMNNTLFLVRI